MNGTIIEASRSTTGEQTVATNRNCSSSSNSVGKKQTTSKTGKPEEQLKCLANNKYTLNVNVTLQLQSCLLIIYCKHHWALIITAWHAVAYLNLRMCLPLNAQSQNEFVYLYHTAHDGCGFLYFSNLYIFFLFLNFNRFSFVCFIQFSIHCISTGYSGEIEQRCPSKYMSILFYDSKCTILVLIIRYVHLNKWTGLIKAWNTVFNFMIAYMCLFVLWVWVWVSHSTNVNLSISLFISCELNAHTNGENG